MLRSAPGRLRPLVFMLVGAIVGILATGGVLITSAATGTINACVTTRPTLAGPTGSVRIVASAADCRPSETFLTWNQIGPIGPKGDPGPAGPPGPAGGIANPVINGCTVVLVPIGPLRTSCPNAILQGVDLNGVNLARANLRGVYLVSARLNGANLTLADLREAQLAGVKLAFADLTGADLSSGTTPIDTSLQEADLFGANLTNANLTNAYLGEASLFRANLTNANFTGADLRTTSLGEAIWNNTTCPDGTNSNSHGNTCIGHLTRP